MGLITITNANYDYAAEKKRKERVAASGDGRMMARRQELPIFTIEEFNYKVGWLVSGGWGVRSGGG